VSVALGIQPAKRMRRIMSSLACFPIQCFSILSHKIHDFRKENIEHKMFGFSLPLLYETFLSISSLDRAFRKITSNINQQMHPYNFHLKHFKNT